MKKRFLLLICAVLFFFVQINEALAAYKCVDPAGGGDYTDIQSALDYADNSGESDVIQVVQGIYYDNFNYSSSQGYDITLLGGYTAGCANRIVDPSNTILDGNKADRVLYINDNGGGDITVEGFTIQNGSSSGYGAGLTISSSISPGTSSDITVTNNIVIDNTATGPNSGGIYVNSQSNEGTAGLVTITNNKIFRNSAQTYGGVYARSFSITGVSTNVVFTGNTISGNIATDYGAGAYVYSSAGGISGNVTCTNNTFTQNTAENNYGALRMLTDTDSGTAGDIVFVNNTITGNSADYYAGASIQSDAGSGDPGTVTITNNTVTANTAHTRNGGIYIYMNGNTNDVYNNIIWGNISPERADINLIGSGTANGYNNDYTVISGAWTSGETNIDVDPDFIDPDNGDFRLRSTSSCKDVGNNGAPSVPSEDFEGDFRPLDATVDIGADEVSVVTTCVSDETGFHNALTTAQSNSKGDVIMFQRGSYNGNFSYSSGETNNITLLGGYSSSCASRTIDPTDTILDGGGTDGVLDISNSSSGNITVSGFTIQNGSDSTSGGGLSAQSSGGNPSGHITISHNIIKSNSAQLNGGGVAAYTYTSDNAGNISLINNLIINNTAKNTDKKGGGADLNTFSTSGGSAGTITVINNTIGNNSAGGNGGGLYLHAALNGIVNAHNNIIWGNTAINLGGDVYLFKGAGAVATAYNNDAEDGAGAAWDIDVNNIDADPMFTNKYSLKPGSPCIDNGVLAAAIWSVTDIQGKDRIIDGNKDGTANIDMGAFEYISKGTIAHFLLLLL